MVSWKQCLSDNQAWDTLTWFAALIAMAAYLNKYGFITWFSDKVGGAAVYIEIRVAIRLLCFGCDGGNVAHHFAHNRSNVQTPQWSILHPADALPALADVLFRSLNRVLLKAALTATHPLPPLRRWWAWWAAWA